MVGDDQEPCVGLAGHLIQQVTEPRDVGIIKRRVDLVEHTDRRGIGQEHRKDQRQRGQGLLAPRQQLSVAELSCPAADT